MPKARLKKFSITDIAYSMCKGPVGCPERAGSRRVRCRKWQARSQELSGHLASESPLGKFHNPWNWVALETGLGSAQIASEGHSKAHPRWYKELWYWQWNIHIPKVPPGPFPASRLMWIFQNKLKTHKLLTRNLRKFREVAPLLFQFSKMQISLPI